MTCFKETLGGLGQIPKRGRRVQGGIARERPFLGKVGRQGDAVGELRHPGGSPMS